VRALGSALGRAFSTPATPAPAPEKTKFGGLEDKDRIFNNIYGRHDISIKVGDMLV
jgi:hypothetical protein